MSVSILYHRVQSVSAELSGRRRPSVELRIQCFAPGVDAPPEILVLNFEPGAEPFARALAQALTLVNSLQSPVQEPSSEIDYKLEPNSISNTCPDPAGSLHSAGVPPFPRGKT